MGSVGLDKLSPIHVLLDVHTEMYCSELASGQCDGTASPRVAKETLATALVDGQNGIGSVS